MKYQDYVIKDGKFVGEFENMYQRIDDPWHQSEELYYSSISRISVCNFVNRFNIKSMVEFGCGLGQTTNFINDNTGVQILGIDVSKTAIQKSRASFPHLQFEIDNILNILNYSNFECMFFSELTWYILEDRMIDKVFDKMREGLKGRYFVHNLVFYKGNIQKYGRNYFSNFNEFIKFCPFQLLGKVEIDFLDDTSVGTSSIFEI